MEKKAVKIGKRQMEKGYMGRRRGILLAAALVTSMLLSACGSNKDEAYGKGQYNASAASSYAGDFYTEEAVAEYDEQAYDTGAYEDGMSVEAEQVTPAAANRKLIKTVNMGLETEDFDRLIPGLEDEINGLGGYIEDMSVYSRDNYYDADFRGKKHLRYASITARIPREKLDGFLKRVGEQTNVISRSENVEDVTLQYVDLDSHKKVLLAEQERLLDLMEMAETIEDIITIESRLSEVRYQIESMESQLRTYDNKIDYSTVYLDIDEVEQYTPVEEVGTGEKIKTGFMESLTSVGDAFYNLFVWLVIKLPILVVWAIIIVILIFIIRKIVKKSAVKREKKRVAKEEAKKAYGKQLYGQSPYGQQGYVPQPQNQPAQAQAVPTNSGETQENDQEKK